MKPVTVTDQNFDQEVLQAQTKVLVDMWAPWCGPCRMMAPVVEEIAAEYEGSLKVCKLARYGVMSIPTLLVFENGQVVNKLIGFRPKRDLIGEIGV